jgi:ribose-phosphate pyrophosphokinase
MRGEVLQLTQTERDDVVIASGSVNPELAEDIATTMGTELSPMELLQFSDSEPFARFKENIRKRQVIIVQAVAQRENFSAADALMELCQMIQAAKLASAEEITAMLTYYGFGRQDRKADSRTPISAQLVAQFYEVAGADVLMGVDFHSQQIQGFFRKKFDSLTVIPELRGEVRRDVLATRAGEFVVASLDAGATKLAQQCAEELDLGMVQFIKSRSKQDHDTVDTIEVPPGVRGKTIIAFEDIIATGSTAMKTAERAKQEGAEGFMIAAAHGQFSGDALEEAPNSAVDHFYITDTLPTGHIKNALGDMISIVPVGHVIGRALLKSIRGESISEMFNGQHLR